MILNENTENIFNEDFNQIKKEAILNEQYYGSNKYTDALDALFQEALDLTKTEREATKLTTIGIGANINTKKISSIEQRMEKIIKEWFNFSEVQLTFEPFTSINACTICIALKPSSFVMNPKYNKVINKYGIRYEKPETHAVIKIATEFLTVTGVTNKMLTGILLHEIGHNFYSEVSITKSITEFILVSALIKGISTAIEKISKGDTQPLELYKLIEQLSISISALGFTGGAYTKIMNYIEKTPLNTIFKFTKFGMGIVNTAMNTFQEFITYFNIPLQIAGLPIKMLISGINATLLRHKYRDELFADNFATAYGYGEHVLQVQRLFINGDYSLASSFMNHFKLLAMYKDLLQLPNVLFLGFEDVHPDNVARMIDQITYIEDNLKLESNKDKRKAMTKELAEMKNIYKKFQDDLKKDGNLARRGKLLSALLLKMNDESKGKIAYRFDKVTNTQRIDGVWKALV